MAQYLNGKETKLKLYQSSKELFYANGFDNTTIKEIITRADSKLGLFTYYFDSKEAVGVQIYKEYTNDIILALLKPLSSYYKRNEVLLTDMLEYRLFFKCLFDNANVRKFYTDICKTNLFTAEAIKMQYYYFERRMSQENAISHEALYPKNSYDLDVVMPSLAGMETNFIYSLFSSACDAQKFNDSVDSYMRMYNKFFIKDENLTEELIRRSKSICKIINIKINPDFSVEIL